VTIFTTPTCHTCKVAKEWLGGFANLTVVDVSQDIEKAKFIAEKTGKLSVPVIKIGRKYLSGFDKIAIIDLLSVTGY